MNNFKNPQLHTQEKWFKIHFRTNLDILDGRKAGLPQLFPGPGHQHLEHHKSKTKMTVFAKPNFPFTGERASPVLGAMQGLNPDLRMHAWKTAKHIK